LQFVGVLKFVNQYVAKSSTVVLADRVVIA